MHWLYTRKKCGKTPEFMVFNDVLAVLFEELFCLKEKKMLHVICTAANQQSDLSWIYLKVF